MLDFLPARYAIILFCFSDNLSTIVGIFITGDSEGLLDSHGHFVTSSKSGSISSKVENCVGPSLASILLDKKFGANLPAALATLIAEANISSTSALETSSEVLATGIWFSIVLIDPAKVLDPATPLILCSTAEPGFDPAIF